MIASPVRASATESGSRCEREGLNSEQVVARVSRARPAIVCFVITAETPNRGGHDGRRGRDAVNGSPRAGGGGTHCFRRLARRGPHLDWVLARQRESTDGLRTGRINAIRA